MSKIDNIMKKQLKTIEYNNKLLNDTFLSDLTKDQIFEIFNDCNYYAIKCIISNKANLDINMVYMDKTLLFDACMNQNEEVVRLLLSNTATDVNQARTDDGYTPLILACDHGHEGVVQLLLSHPAVKVNQATTDDGSTPLYIATIMNHVSVVKLLLDYPNTNVNHITNFGDTSFYMACAKNYKEVVKMLLTSVKTDVNQVETTDYLSPLFIACVNDNLEVVQLLLSDDRTYRNRPTFKFYYEVYDRALKNVISERNAKFRGLIRAAIVFRRMRLRAALKIYAPGGAGFHAASASFNAAIDK